MNGRTRLAPMSRQHLVRWALPAIVACLAIAGCGSSTSTSSASRGDPRCGCRTGRSGRPAHAGA